MMDERTEARQQTKHIPWWIGLALIVTLTTGGGLLHGRLSNRWGADQSMTEAALRLRQIPSRIGTWQQTGSARELSKTERSMLECAGDITRNYMNSTTDELIGMTLIVGPSGPTSVHTPEICFPSQNYKLVRKRERIKIRDSAGVDHEFWMAEFRAQDLTAQRLHVYYGWCNGDHWSAPEDPRYEFAGSPFLYKLQLSGTMTSAASRRDEDSVPDFLRSFLSETGIQNGHAASSR